MTSKPRSIGELRRTSYRSRSVRDEIRENLIAAMRRGDQLFPGIVGYDDTVTPALTNAMLAGHDVILLGLRGQAKTRILRALTEFLDPEVPVIRGVPLNDDPLAPVTREGRRLIVEHGDDVEIDWWPREERYQEKLATPDVTMSDLLGDLDPIRAAARGESILDEEAIAYGIIPRTNRGIFAINELPDLSPRIQVALLNVMEERDVQIRGFPVRIPLDLLLVFSANPEDYTRRGNLVTPLRDRIASQILTHYPRTLEDGMAITRQEAELRRDGPTVHVPEIAYEIVEQVAFVARDSEWVDQSSGVSARLTIALLEAIVSNAERRALVGGLEKTSVRISDFVRCTAAICGKVELVFEGEKEGPEKVALHLVGKAVQQTFDLRFPDFFSEPRSGDSPYADLADFFKDGGAILTDDLTPDGDLEERLVSLPGMAKLIDDHLPGLEPFARGLGAELVLEGLHQHSVLAKEMAGAGAVFSDMVAGMWDGVEPGGSLA